MRAVDVGYTYGVHGVSLELGSGLVGVLGPNGSGKSTLLKLLAGVLQPTRGEISLEGKRLDRIPRRELAQRLAFVPQKVELPFPFRCRELVMMGRYARMRGAGLDESRQEEAVLQALRATGVEHLKDRRFGELSGGEAQRVRIAQALAQEGQIMLLDEPTSHLDIAHQLELMSLLGQLAGQGQAILVSLHDLNLAALYCQRLLLLKEGRLLAEGAPGEVLTEETLAQAYGVRLAVEPGPPLRVYPTSCSSSQRFSSRPPA